MNKELAITVQTSGWLNPMFGDEKSKEAFEFIKGCGFEALDYNLDTKLIPAQINKSDKGTFYTKSLEEIYEYYKPIKAAFEESGIYPAQAHASFPLYRRTDADYSEYLMEVFEKQMAICAYLGIPALVAHPCNYLDKDNERECNYRMYRRMIPIGKKYPTVKICLENIPNKLANHCIAGVCCTFEEAIEYIDTLNAEAGCDMFGFCFDMGHANISGANPLDFIKKLGHRLTVLHLHENDGRNDQHYAPYTQRYTGWSTLIDGLRAIKYRGPLNFETCAAIMGGYPRELFPAMLKYIAEVGEYMRKEILKDE